MESLLKQLDRQRTRLRNLFLCHGAAQVVLRALGIAVVLFLVDYLTDPPRTARIILTLLGIGYIGFTVYRYLFYPLSRRFSTEEIALTVEKRFPHLDGGLVSALQFHRLDEKRLRNMSPSLVSAAKDLAEEKSRDVSWKELYDTGNVKKLTALTLACFLFVAGYAFTHTDLTGIFAARMMGGAEEWPRKTTLLILLQGVGDNYKLLTEPDPRGVQEVLIARGTSLPIEVQVEGKEPKEVVVRSQSDSAGTLVSMATRRGEGDFRYRFRNVRDDMRFWVEGGDDDGSGRYVDVSVVIPPQMLSLDAEYRYPEYLGLENERRLSTQIEGPEGTEVRAAFSVSSPVEKATIALRTGAGEEVHPLVPDAENPLVLRHTVRLAHSGTYRIHLEDGGGFTNTDAPYHSIIVRKDAPPRVKLYAPRRSDMDVAPRGVVVFRATAEDDYGIKDFGLKFKSAGEESWERHAFTDEERDAPLGARKIVSGHVMDFDVKRLDAGGEERKLDRGDVVLYTVEALDFRPALDEGRTETGQHGINIVSENEKIRILTELQIRLKEDVRSLKEQQTERWERGKALLEEPQVTEQLLVSLEVGQNKLTNRFRSASREMAQIFDGYLFNRLDRTSAASVLLERAVQLRLASEVSERFDSGHYQALVDLYASNQLGEMDLMERLIVMLGFCLRISDTLSPEVSGWVAKAVVAVDGGDVAGYVEQSVKKQEEILATLDELLAKMDEWEDYQELLQLFRDVIDAQNNVNIMTREELRKNQ